MNNILHYLRCGKNIWQEKTHDKNTTLNGKPCSRWVFCAWLLLFSCQEYALQKALLLAKNKSSMYYIKYIGTFETFNCLTITGIKKINKIIS